MPRVAYIERNFSDESEIVIGQAEQICAEYMADGFVLTLRQLYYQFVRRNWLANTERNYKRLGSIINDARLAGRLDWDAIEDRTRNLQTLDMWDSPREILERVAGQFRFDPWESQAVRVEVWIEKDALTGVIEPICNRYRVPYFACRGYTSQSEQWRAGQRFMEYNERGQRVLVLHLGDHDPSGVDMTRDNLERLTMFTESGDIELKRIALNMDQIRRYDPPPNPAKFTDARANSYVARFGRSSWELDALEPRVIARLIEAELEDVINQDRWQEHEEREKRARERLTRMAKRWKDEQ